MSNQSVSIYATALKRQQQEAATARSDKPASNTTQKATRAATASRDHARDTSRAKPRTSARGPSRKNPRNKNRQSSRDLPTRDEVQEFSFRLRDELKVKVQAEVPHHWHGELEQIARDLDVKKLELYRFIIGEFLGKVRRKDTS